MSSHTVGAIASTPSGQLIYSDLDLNEIETLTPTGPRQILRAPDRWPATITGLATDGNRIWFADGGRLYEADLAGSGLRRVPAVGDVDSVQALSNGAVVYSTSPTGHGGSIFERFANGRTVLLVGNAGSSEDESPYNHSTVPASSADIGPTSFALAGDGLLYIVDAGNILEEVRNGVVTRMTDAAFNGAVLTASPNGVVYGVVFRTIDRFADGTLRPLGEIPNRVDGQFAAPVSIAPAPSGGLYLAYTDQVASTGALWRSGVIRISSSGSSTPLVESQSS